MGHVQHTGSIRGQCVRVLHTHTHTRVLLSPSPTQALPVTGRASSQVVADLVLCLIVIAIHL